MSSEYPTAPTPAGQEADRIYQQGYELYQQKHYDIAEPLITQSLALYRQVEHLPGILRALHILANIAFERGQYTTARSLHEQVLEMCRAAQIMVGVASSLNNLGLVAQQEGKYMEAIVYLEDSIRTYETIDDEAGANAARANLESLSHRGA